MGILSNVIKGTISTGLSRVKSIERSNSFMTKNKALIDRASRSGAFDTPTQITRTTVTDEGKLATVIADLKSGKTYYPRSGGVGSPTLPIKDLPKEIKEIIDDVEDIVPKVESGEYTYSSGGGWGEEEKAPINWALIGVIGLGALLLFKAKW